MGAVRSPEDLDRAGAKRRQQPLKTHRRPRPANPDIVSEAMRVDPQLRMMIAPDELDSL